MGILASLAINAAIYLAVYLYRRYAASKEDGPNRDDISFPRNTQGSRRPLVYGRCLVESPILLAYGDPDFRTHQSHEGERTLWYASIHYGICATNINIADDQNERAQFLGVWLGKKKLGALGNPGGIDPEWDGKTGPNSWIVHGRETSAEGEWDDDDYLYFGEAVFTTGAPDLTMDINAPYRQVQEFYSRLNGDTTDSNDFPYVTYDVTDGSNFSPMRNWVTCLLTNPPLIGDSNDDIGGVRAFGFRWGKSPNIPGAAFEIVNPVRIPGVNPAFMEINGGDANPAGVLYDLLVNKTNGRLGYDPAKVNTTNFGNVALVLWIEQNGMSRVFYQDTEVKNIIYDIEKQIDGKLYENPETGLWEIKLTREDYSIPSLPHYKDYSDGTGPANIIKVVGFENIGWRSVANTVRCHFNASDIYVKDSITGQDYLVPYYDTQVAETKNQASAALAESDEPVDIEYPGVTNPDLAARIVTRDIRALSLPLARATIQVNRSAFFAYPNQVVKATHAHWGSTTIVFRVLEVDLGEFESNAITLELVQDRWAVNYTAPDGTPYPPVIGPTNSAAVSPADVVVEEAPRFWQNLAVLLGLASDADVQKLWYFARAEGENTGYRGGVLVDAQPVPGSLIHNNDTQRVRHGGTFQVAEGYSKQNDPYDTGSGIRIRNLVGWTPAVATAADIRTYGVNIIYINGELLAYENFTDEGGGEYYLTPLWRGLGGTVPRDHAEEDGYGFIIDPILAMKAMGATGFLRAQTADARVSGLRGQSASPYYPSRNETDLTIRRRALLPGTVADLKVGYGLPLGTYTTPAKVVEDANQYHTGMVMEGLDFTFKARSRTDDSLVRGDAAAQTQPDVGTTFSVVVIKEDGTEVVVASGSTDIDEYDQVSTAEAGYGSWEVGVRSNRTITEGGSSVELSSWQTPTIPVTAYEFRNLLMNWMFQGGAYGPYWVTVSGTPLASGGNGPSIVAQVIKDNSGAGTIEFKQTVSVLGWKATGMRSVLEFYTKQLDADTNDTVEVQIETLDDGAAQLDTDTYGPTAPGSTWSKLEVEIPACDSNTESLRVTITEDATDPPEPDGTTSGVVTEMLLMLGQFTDELLTNPHFESGLTGWTTGAGGFTDTTSNAKIGTHRIQGNANVTNRVYQEVAIPAGYQHSWAVLRASIYHPGPSVNASGTLLVEARNGAGGTVLASGTYVFTPTLDANWFPLLAYCDVPHDATHIRVSLQGNRLSGTNNQLSFDDVSLRIHKKLVPEFERTYDFTPVVQDLPRSAAAWRAAYPNVTLPLAMFSPEGGGIGNEPPVVLRGSTRVGRMNGLWDSDDQISRQAWELRRGETSGLYVNSQTFGAFPSTQSFTVRVVYDLREQNIASSARILACRYDGFVPAGWVLGIDGSGRTYASLYSPGGSVTVNAGDGGHYGPGPTYAAITYDAASDTLTVSSPYGSNSSSTASVTDILPDLSQYVHGMGIGYDPQGTTNDTPRAMIASVEVWNEALDYTTLSSVWTGGSFVGQPGSILERGLVAANAVVATVVGQDAAGDDLIAYYGTGVDVQGRPANRWGVAFGRNRTNKVVANPNTTTDWTVGAGTAVVLDAARAPDGSYDTVSITGDSAHYREHTFVMGVGNTVNVSFCGWVSTAGNIQVQLLETDGTVIDTETVAMTTNRRRVDITFTGWVNGTPSAKIRFIPSDTGTDRTFYLAGPFFVDQDQDFRCPVAIPVHGSSRTRYTYEALGLPAQWNYEGEIVVEVRGQSNTQFSGAIVSVANGSANGRQVYVDASIAGFSHWDSAASDVPSINSPATETWSDDQTLRARWNRAGLLDQANAFAGIVTENISQSSTYGRTTTFSGTGAGLDTLSLGKNDGEGADGQCEFLMLGLTLRGREGLL